MVTIRFQNINCDRRIGPSGYAKDTFAAWTVSNRIDAILRNIGNPEIMALCEIDDATLPQIMRYFEARDYRCFSCKYAAGDPGSYNHMVAVRNDVNLVSFGHFYFTLTPGTPLTLENRANDPVLIAGGEEYEKSAIYIIVKDERDHNQLIVATQFSIRRKYRAESIAVLQREIEALSRGYDASVILIGNFNCFADEEGLALFSGLEAAGFEHVGDLSMKTFISYPYDFDAQMRKKHAEMFDSLEQIADLAARRNAYAKAAIDFGLPFHTRPDYVLVRGCDARLHIERGFNVGAKKIRNRFLRSVEKNKPLTNSDNAALTIIPTHQVEKPLHRISNKCFRK